MYVSKWWIHGGLFAWLLGVSLGAHAEIALLDDRGIRVVLKAPPLRIVSLLPSHTESICALGGCARLVGTDRYSNSPPQVKTLPKLGGLDDARVEGIVVLKPDVVVMAPSARVMDRLEGLGIKVLVLDSKTHADVARSLRKLAIVLGEPKQATIVWERIERDLNEAILRVPASLRGQRVYFEVDSAPYAAGVKSFIGETLRRLGVGNIVPPSMGPFPKLNPEFVVRANPDIVMAAQRSLNDMPVRPGWRNLRALAQRRSCGFTVDQYELLVRPGPRLGEAALLMADCLSNLGKAH